MFILKKLLVGLFLSIVIHLNVNAAGTEYMNNNQMMNSKMNNSNKEMRLMNKSMTRMKNEKDPIKRNALWKAHIKQMKDHMDQMQGMMGMMNGMMGEMGSIVDKDFTMCLKQ